MKNPRENKLVRSELNLEQNAVFTVSTFRGMSRDVTLENKDGEEIGRVTVGRALGGVEVALFGNLLDTFVHPDLRKNRLWCKHQ